MSVKEIRNKKTGEHGYQAIVRDQSRYFSIKLHGKKEARELATKAEIDLCTALGLTVKEFKEQARRQSTPKGKNATVGLHLQWKMRKGSATGMEYATIRGFVHGPNGKPGNICVSIHRHGLDKAIHLAFAKRIACGLPIPDYNDTYAGMCRQILEEGQGKTYRSV